MVVQALSDSARTDLQFQALADATRRDIVRLVLQGEHSVSDLARRYPMSFAAVQKHVAVLERAELITKHRRGRERLVRGRVDALHDLNRLLDELETLWRARLHRFGEVLAEPDEGEHPCP
jgi:DNA-binding transcriptional ArsR family regulator